MEKNNIFKNKFFKNKFDSYKDKPVLVRSPISGVHFGKCIAYSPEYKTIILGETQRLWSYDGAFTLSAVAKNGVARAKISVEYPELIVAEVAEVIPLSDEIYSSLKSFDIWGETL